MPDDAPAVRVPAAFRRLLAGQLLLIAVLVVGLVAAVSWGDRQREGRAEAERREQDEARHVGKARALVALERSQAEFDRAEANHGDWPQTALGLLWLAHALEAAPPEEAELCTTLRRLLGGWREELPLPA